MEEGKTKEQLINELAELCQRITELEALEAERKRAGEEIKELLEKIERAKQEWESTADSLPDLVCLLDDQGRIIRANRIVETWNLGRVVDVKGRGVHELLHPGCAGSSCYLESFWKQAWEEAMRGQSAQCEAYDEVLKRHVLVRLQPWKGWGKRTAIGSRVVTVRDITERKRAEEALREFNAALEERVHQRTFELQVLYELSQQIGYTLNYDELFRLMLEHLHRAVAYDVSASLLVTEDVCELFIRPTRPLSPAVQKAIQERLVNTFATLSGQSVDLERLNIRFLGRAASDETASPIARLGSVFQVPLIVGEEEEVVGLLFIGAEQEEAFTEDHVRLLYTVANQASLSVRRLSALLGAERQRLESLVERLPEGVLLLDAEGHLVLANPAAREYLPLLADVGVRDVLTHLGGRPLKALLRPRASGLRPEAQPEGLPHVITVEGPPRRVLEVATRPIEAGPDAGGWVLVLRDVTWERELLATERSRRQELDALYSLSRQLVATDKVEVVLDSVARHAVQTVHVTFCRILTVEDGAFVCRAAHSVRPLECDLGVGRPDPAPTWPHYQRVLSQGEPVVLRQDDPALSAGERQALLLDLAQNLYLVPLQVGDEPVGIVVLGETRSATREPFDADKLRRTAAIADQAASAIHRTKLHERLERANIELEEWSKELERRVEERTRELKEAQESLIRAERLATIGQLGASVGHELRNPLGVIKNSAYYLNMRLRDADEKVKKHLKIMEREISRSNKIINDLLNFARVKEPTLQETDANFLVKEALSRTPVPENVAVVTELGEDLRPLMADPDQIEQVFINMISNAVQAMSDGGRLEIATKAEDGFIVMEFNDNGCGIPAENLEKIFEPLFTTKARGIGMGLAVSRRIVEAHNGSIEVESPSTGLRPRTEPVEVTGPSTEFIPSEAEGLRPRAEPVEVTGPSTELGTGEVGKGTTFRIKLPMLISQSPSLNEEKHGPQS